MGVNEKFIINLQGKQFVTYEGLLDLAHQKGLKSLEVEIIQMPTSENNMTAVCIAIGTTENSMFQDIGDASPSSVNRGLTPHLIRMASTRAKARVLRDLTNVGMTAIEELSEEDNTVAEQVEEYVVSTDPPTQRQMETLNKLAGSMNKDINYETLTKKSAASIISRSIEEKKNS